MRVCYTKAVVRDGHLRHYVTSAWAGPDDKDHYAVLIAEQVFQPQVAILLLTSLPRPMTTLDNQQ